MVGSSIKAVFFDLKDTLGYVDRAGHLVTFKPSTDELLNTVKAVMGVKIGVITNLPKDLDAAAGRKMIEDAGLLPYLAPQGIVINHDVGVDKPDPEIYRIAARQIGEEIEDCLFSGENYLEVLGAQIAGMQGLLKPCPPGREFLLKPIAARAMTDKDSGRLSEIIMQEDHLIGKRIVVAANEISARLAAFKPPPLKAMSLLVFLVTEFIDRYHHVQEEKVLIPLAQAYGYPAQATAYVIEDHERGRLFFRSLAMALDRFKGGEEAALLDFKVSLDGFVNLYREHARRENDVSLPGLGALLDGYQDAVIVDLMDRFGPGDLAPWLQLISEMERDLGIVPA